MIMNIYEFEESSGHKNLRMISYADIFIIEIPFIDFVNINL